MQTDLQAKPAPSRRTLPQAAPSPDAFAHVVLRTSNYPAMIDWYRHVLNAEVVFRNDKLCFLTYDDEHHRVAILHVPGLRALDETSSRLAHIAYSYNDLGSLLATYRRLKALGILPYRPINHGPTVSLYYRDPDGTAIELQVDVFATKDETRCFFESEAFRENPIGVAFDPEVMLAAYEAGTPEEELKRRPAGPPAPAGT
jgi:catechol 2,3-dioxygenase-like lactoylglutathione lyase family enzyme